MAYATTENKYEKSNFLFDSGRKKHIDLSRKKVVILDQLRIGHTKFTHGHLMAKIEKLHIRP